MRCLPFIRQMLNVGANRRPIATISRNQRELGMRNIPLSNTPTLFCTGSTLLGGHFSWAAVDTQNMEVALIRAIDLLRPVND
jgi:hypothetical protein